MATLQDLRNRIISETTRDDLADTMAGDLDNIIQKSIDAYANESWWFNEKVTTVPCVVNNSYLPLPLGFRKMVELFAVIGGVRYTMTVRSTAEILELYSTPQVGQPTDYALDGDNAFLWPQPNQNYPLLFDVILDVTPPLDYTAPASSNIWTNQGQDLITAESKVRLYRDYLSAVLQDTRVISANNQREEFYANLRAESNRRMSTGKVRPGW